MYPAIKAYCDKLAGEFQYIPKDRRSLLKRITDFIAQQLSKGVPVNLVYICTHNSRRSHFGQVWAKVAGAYYSIPLVNTYSGGTEATTFNSHSISAMVRAGFKISPVNSEENRLYDVYYDGERPPIECFSKTFDDPKNPQTDFAAIMTCGEAEENCPFIPGATLRIVTTYEDPGSFDGSPLRNAKYDERCRQIALETFYAFSLVNSNS